MNTQSTEPWDTKEPMDRELPDWMTDSPIDHEHDGDCDEKDHQDAEKLAMEAIKVLKTIFPTSAHTFEDNCPECDRLNTPYFTVDDLHLLNIALLKLATGYISLSMSGDRETARNATESTILIANLGIKVTSLRQDMQAGKTTGVHRAGF